MWTFTYNVGISLPDYDETFSLPNSDFSLLLAGLGTNAYPRSNGLLSELRASK